MVYFAPTLYKYCLLSAPVFLHHRMNSNCLGRSLMQLFSVVVLFLTNLLETVEYFASHLWISEVYQLQLLGCKIDVERVWT